MTADAMTGQPHRVAYRLTEFAAMVGKEPRSIRALHAKGKIPGKRLGRDIMVPADFVAEYGPLPAGGQA